MKPGLQTAHNVVDIVALHDASSLSQSKQFAAVQATQATGAAVTLTTKFGLQAPTALVQPRDVHAAQPVPHAVHVEGVVK